MVQPPPTYPGMTTTQCPPILDLLTKRYGPENVAWPVIFYQSSTFEPDWLTFEVNERNETNHNLKERFFNNGSLEEYFIDYTVPIRTVVPLTGAAWPNPP